MRSACIFIQESDTYTLVDTWYLVMNNLLCTFPDKNEVYIYTKYDSY